MEGWVEIVSLFNNMLVLGHNQLQHDTSMSGTLFQLWESVRRCPGRDNILVLMNYLDYLSGNSVSYRRILVTEGIRRQRVELAS
jgi:hypothetical protein